MFWIPIINWTVAGTQLEERSNLNRGEKGFYASESIRQSHSFTMAKRKIKVLKNLEKYRRANTAVPQVLAKLRLSGRTSESHL